MDDQKLEAVIRTLRQHHQRRYAEAAYFFVLEALDYTMFRLGKTRSQGEDRHISVAELLDGIREYAREEFGPLAPFAFRSWGVHRTEDFGAIVFQMCEVGLLKRRAEDRPEDFANGFDFSRAFNEAEGLTHS
ncbi:MAG: hypothetical protein D6702_05775 [Planctomycetota bacterium]|nr:MAG: hypothetical protein D6702_05775 [Planctomycetota bacterium]